MSYDHRHAPPKLGLFWSILALVLGFMVGYRLTRRH